MLPAVSGATGTSDALDSEFKILFPEIVQQKINTVEFLAAARGVVRIVGKLGKVFAPVRSDIQGNIDVHLQKIEDDLEKSLKRANEKFAIHNHVKALLKPYAIPAKNIFDRTVNNRKLAARYATDTERNVTLQDMILIEKSADPKLVAMDALLWLTRGLHMILLFFEKIVEDSKTDSPTEDFVAFLKKSYKEALEPYHGWMAQQLFDILSRMVPTRTKLLSALSADGQTNENDIISDIEIYLINLRENVMEIQSFYKAHNLEDAR